MTNRYQLMSAGKLELAKAAVYTAARASQNPEICERLDKIESEISSIIHLLIRESEKGD